MYIYIYTCVYVYMLRMYRYTYTAHVHLCVQCKYSHEREFTAPERFTQAAYSARLAVLGNYHALRASFFFGGGLLVTCFVSARV
jgi:hypothetical protein